MNRFSRWLRFRLRYFGEPPWDTGISPPELLAFLESHPPGRAIDLGCGTGTNAITMAQHGWKVTAVDFVGHAIRTARRKARAAAVDVDFRLGDVTRLNDLAQPYDLVLDIGCFHAVPPKRREAYAHNVVRLLAPGGTYLLYTFPKTPEWPERGIGEADLAALSPPLQLRSRQDGTERGRRPSAWFTFVKP